MACRLIPYWPPSFPPFSFQTLRTLDFSMYQSRRHQQLVNGSTHSFVGQSVSFERYPAGYNIIGGVTTEYSQNWFECESRVICLYSKNQEKRTNRSRPITPALKFRQSSTKANKHFRPTVRRQVTQLVLKKKLDDAGCKGRYWQIHHSCLI
jgi:hypothetical protein